MKTPFRAALLTLLTVAAVYGQETEELKTLDGDSYTGVKLLRVEGETAHISHANGMASIALSNLPSSFREKNGILPGLQEVRSNYRDSIVAWLSGLDELNGHYDAALQKLEQTLSAGGDLEGVIEVRDERKSFRTRISPQESAIPELSKLQGIYSDSLQRWHTENANELVKHTQKYLADLEALKERLIEEEKTEEAKEVEAEFARYSRIANDPEAIQMELKAGPAFLLARKQAANISPDGNMEEKKAGTMFLLKAGNQVTLEGPSEDISKDIVDVQADGYTWAALTESGRLISSPLKNGEIPADHKKVNWFRVGSDLVTAFHDDGSVSVFGEPFTPRDAPPADLRFVVDFAQDRGSGIALLDSGEVRVWGSMYAEEEQMKEVVSTLQHIRFVGASDGIAWAADDTGNVFSWTGSTLPAAAGKHESIAQFRGGKSAYLVLTDKGNLEGGAVGGENPIVHVPEGQREGVAIRVSHWGYALQWKDGRWHTWGGGPFSAPVHAQIKSAPELTDLEIYASQERFVIMGIFRK